MLLSRRVGVVVVAFALAVSATACLRSRDTPDAWPCGSDADCRDDKTCFYSSVDGLGTCRASDYCELDSECSALALCKNFRCEVLECTAQIQDACAPYVCSNNACLTACQSSLDCDAQHACSGGQCVPNECEADQAASDCNGYACVERICRRTCASGLDCAYAFVCQASGSCVPAPQADGASCTIDAQCASGHCCATHTPDTYACAATCPFVGIGQACSWDAICQSKTCNGQVCVSCTSEQCRLAICGERVCGMANDVECGSCGAKEYCDSAGKCADACVDRECGMNLGVDCGSCDGLNYCTASGSCEPACVDLACGNDHGVFCGDCSGETYCDAANSCQPWTDCPPGSGVSRAPSATLDRGCAECVSAYTTTTNAMCTPWSAACVGVEATPPSTMSDRECYDGWTRNYGTPARGQEGWAITPVAGGDVIVGGAMDRQDNFPTFYHDEYAYIRRIDSDSGDVAWENLSGTTSLNRVRALDTDAAGHVFAAGYAYSDVGGGHVGDGDVFIKKLAVADGAVSWTRNLGTTAFDVATSVAVGPDGHVFVAGFSAGALAGNRVATGNMSDTFAFKLSSVDGSVLWQAQFGPGGGRGIAVDSAGDAFVVGAANVAVPSPEGDGTFTVRKLSGSTGTEIWTQRFGPQSSDWAFAVAVDGAGDAYVHGIHDGRTAVMKLDGSDGARLWVAYVGSSALLTENGLGLTPSGDVLITGTADGDLDGEGEINGCYVFELSGSDGATLWLEQFGIPYREDGHAVAMDAGENIWVTGIRTPDGSEDNSFVTKIVR